MRFGIPPIVPSKEVVSSRDRSFYEAPVMVCDEVLLYLELLEKPCFSISLLRLLVVVAFLILLATPATAADLNDLYRNLLRYGFTIQEKHPPDNAYGRFIPSENRIEISPLVHDLGIARQVFLHEAVHAAQSCPNGNLSLIGVQRRAEPVVRSRIQYLLQNHYKQIDFALEQEAFVIQSQSDAEQIIIMALNERCVL